MSLTRRQFALGAVAAAGTAGLAACGGGGTSSGGASGGGGGGAKLTSLTVMGPVLESLAPAADGKLQKGIEEFTGVKLNITWVPNSDYGNKTNVVLASGDIPQLMVVQGKTPTFVRSAQAGAFWDLTDKLAKHPNLKTENPEIQKNSSINGKVFGVYRARDAMRTAVIVRKDWLGKYGVQMPKTTNDLYELAKTFTRDGQYGIIIPKWPGGYATASPYDVMEVWYGAPNGWGERDGKLVPGFDTEEFLAANTFMRKMATEKLLNPDFATLDSAKWNDPFFNGKGGIIFDVSSRTNALMNLFKTNNPTNYTDFVEFAGNLVGPDGKKHSYPTIGYNGFIAIPKTTIKTEAELDSVLQFLNKLNEKKGQVLENNGIEDFNFKVDGNYAVTIKGTEEDVVSNDVKSFAQLGTNVAGYQAYTAKPANAAEQAMYERRLETHKEDLKTAVHNPANALVSETYTTKGPQLDVIIADARVKYIAGQIDLNGLKAEIRRWHTEGGDQIIKEMNELYKK